MHVSYENCHQIDFTLNTFIDHNFKFHFFLIFGLGSQSPDCIRAETLNGLNMNALELSRAALFSMYNNNTSPPNSNNTTSPQNNEPQR